MKRERLDLLDAVGKGTGRNGAHSRDGRFAPGNRASSGRKSRAAWREAFDRACSPADLEAIARRAVKDAKAGDARAREIILQFTLQRPPRLIDLTYEHTPPADLDNDPEASVYD